QGTRLSHGAGRRAAHQRPRAVLLRDDAVGLRMGSRLEPHRGRRNYLGAHDSSGHQHLGSYPGGRAHHRQAGPIQDRRPVVAAPGGQRNHPRKEKEFMMLRIDTHHHMVPAEYRKALDKAGIGDAGGRDMPQWSPEESLEAMDELGIGTAILSVSAPAT